MKFHTTLGLRQTRCVIFIFISMNTIALVLNAACETLVRQRLVLLQGEGPASDCLCATSRRAWAMPNDAAGAASGISSGPGGPADLVMQT